MFQVKIQTYWSDADPAGVVFFPQFFRFIQQAEEEMFRATGIEQNKLLEEHQVWFPRVEAFAKFIVPIRYGDAIQVRMTPTLEGAKTVRYDFEIVGDGADELRAHGHVTVVCVDRATFKSKAIPDPIRNVFLNWSGLPPS